MKEGKKKKWMDSEDLPGISVDICLLRSYCHDKRRGETKGKIKVKYKYCIFSGNCNQKRRRTAKQITLDYLKSKKNHVISSLIKRVRDTISKTSS